jgi:hypothetical protein
MGVPPSEAQALTLYEYQALIFNWQAAHETSEDVPEPPSIEQTEERMRLLEQRGVKVLS